MLAPVARMEVEPFACSICVRRQKAILEGFVVDKSSARRWDDGGADGQQLPVPCTPTSVQQADYGRTYRFRRLNTLMPAFMCNSMR